MTDSTTATGRMCPDCGTVAPRVDFRFCPGCGKALDGGTGDLVPVRRSPAAAWWTRRRIILAAVATLAAVALVASFLVRQSTGDRAAEGPVRAYFAALAAGDPAAALDLLAGVDVASDSPLWSVEVLATGYTPPADVVVAGVDYGAAPEVDRRPNMEYAVVTVRYVLAGQVVEQGVQVTREGDGIERTWSISGIGFALVAVPAGAQVAGLPATGTAETYRGPPGVYTMTRPGDALYVDASAEVPAPPVVGDGHAAPATLPLSIQDSAQDAVNGQVRGLVDDCAATRPLDLDRCPWVVGATYKSMAGRATWTVEVYPEVRVVHTSRGAVLELVEAGRATGRYTIYDQPRTLTADIVPTGAVTLDASGAVTWSHGTD